ncbi:FHA domain-containing protein [Streptomyces sp. NPDC005955]|uniref:FHA domain-containing protein n=1 Tax=Streptomyces sp. NPDC005955 TaxID=3364738 RepID=UPI003694F1B2
MQIRLTVLGPRPEAPGRATARDVLVTAPGGTPLAAVVSGLASAVAGGEGPTAVYAGADRLDPQRAVLGEPPLVDGAVLSLGAPTDPGPDPTGAVTQLQVVGGPDAGGVHLLHGGPVRIGRSADAEVPLDDPDVSRLHCAVTLTEDGRVTVADLGSTNGTRLYGAAIGKRPVPLEPGALLRLGESTLRLADPRELPGPVPTDPDGEGFVRVGVDAPEPTGSDPVPPRTPRTAIPTANGTTGHAYGSADWVAPGAAPHHAPGAGAQDTHAGNHGVLGTPGSADERAAVHERVSADGRGSAYERADEDVHGTGSTRAGARRRGGLTAWARRLRGERGPDHDHAHDDPRPEPVGTDGPHAPDEHTGYAEGPFTADPAAAPELWPDPAALLLTALGPGPRLWERGHDHPEALTVRLGTTDRPAPGGPGVLAGVPVTVGLREAGALGLAGPRPRLVGVARSVVAQLAALHAPESLEIVLLSADRTRPVAERVAEWGWLGWLPHTRPGRGQDCRLLLAYDTDQAAARTAELDRVLAEHGDGPTGDPDARAAADGTLTVLVVDGDPGTPALRDAVARLCAFGPAAGVHVVCLAESAALPSSADAATAGTGIHEGYGAACAVLPPLRECGAVALLGGDVATEVRLVRIAGGAVAGEGTEAAVDAVSGAWAERFARALAPLRAEGGVRTSRAAVPLPRTARLLDELGLARATPASLLARWADAFDDPQAAGGRARVVLGAGPRGPVGVDLVREGTHLLVEGPAGSGRTELLRAVTASLAAAERPDRLSVILVDGRDTTGGPGAQPAGAGGGLTVCGELPHVTTHLAANDPVRMREFAQALSAELKRRAELLGLLDFGRWHGSEQPAGRVVAQRGPSFGSRVSGARPAADGAGDLDPPPSSTLRLRPAGARTAPAPALPRLVVVVDDLDALLSPALGSTGRPSAGSVVRALEAVAREGERLGVHLVAGAVGGARVDASEVARRAGARVSLDAVRGGPEEPGPGRGTLRGGDGRVTEFQGGRVTGRIPRTATLRPTVVVVEWERMGDPPARRSVRELGNGPTDLALLASAVERAARSVSAMTVPSLL